jgi:hypothetical protein
MKNFGGHQCVDERSINSSNVHRERCLAMHDILFLILLVLLIGMVLWDLVLLYFWSYTCPQCHKKQLRLCKGLASVWKEGIEGVREYRFPQAQCRECKQVYFRKNLFFGAWKTDWPY